jgi:hypothetical protein
MKICDIELDPLGVKPLLPEQRQNFITGDSLAFFNPER